VLRSSRRQPRQRAPARRPRRLADRGPRASPPPADFLFPQQSDPELAAPGWRPRLFDYLYVSFTNSIAFSPTDTMPLTQAAKGLMLTEAAVSSVTVLQSALSNRSVHR
jgi:uncharacterized membrane protein